MENKIEENQIEIVKDILQKASVPVDIQGHGICEIIDSGHFESVARCIVQNLNRPDVVGQSEQLVCDVCGSEDVIEAPHMGRNCNFCNPI